MDNKQKIEIFYDGSCPLCRAEIEAIELHDEHGIFAKTDCSSVEFDQTPYLAEGISREAMMTYLHLRTSNGEWLIGVNAFELIYRSLGLNTAAYMWGGKMTRPLTSRLYPWIARNRNLLSLTGLPYLFQVWGKCAARRAYQRSQACHGGKCSIQEKGRI